jgi:hypothetical protein
MSLSASLAIESGHGDDLKWHALALSFTFDGVQGVGRVLCVSDVNLLNRSATGFQQFENCVTPLDLFSAETLFFTTGCAARTADLAARHRAPSLA